MYESFARYYDIIHSSLVADLAYILEIAKGVEGPILELGCGTGRLLLPLARAGCTVTGVDNAPAMLARAHARLKQEPLEVQQRISLAEADLKWFSLAEEESSFSLILLPYNTLLHFKSTDIQLLLRNISRYLPVEGRLFIDIINPFIVAETSYDPEPVLENIYFDQETGETIHQTSLSRLDSAEQCLHTSWFFEVKTNDEQDPVKTTIDFDYWYQYPHQLELLLQQSGYGIDKIAGDYNGSAFEENSDRLLIFARRVPD